MTVLPSMSVPILSPLIGRLKGRLEARTILVHGRDQPVGDGFLQADFFHALRCRFPDAHIAFAISIGGSPYAGALRRVMSPFIDEILSEQALCLRPSQSSPFARSPLSKRRFDLVIDFEKKWWRSLAIRRIPHRVFISASRHFLFSDRWPRQWKKPKHLSDQYMMLLDAVGMPQQLNHPRPDFRVRDCDDFVVQFFPKGPVYVGLVPGAGDRGKCWPLDSYNALGRRLLSQGMVPVYLLGPQEKDWVTSIRNEVPGALLPAWSGEAMLAEFSNPLQTVAVGPYLAAAVANDCGVAHMLAAAHTPLVALFGHTNAVKYAPRTKDLRILNAHDYGSHSISSIPLEAVVQSLAHLMADCRVAR